MNARLPTSSVFDLCQGKVSRYELKAKRTLHLGLEQPLFAVQFGILGKES